MLPITHYTLSRTSFSFEFRTLEPRYNEPRHNKDPDITNDIFQPRNSKMYEREPDIMNPYNNEHMYVFQVLVGTSLYCGSAVTTSLDRLILSSTCSFDRTYDCESQSIRNCSDLYSVNCD